LSPSFWLFAALAAPLLIWGARSDSNPVGLYLLLLQLIPSTPIELPGFGSINRFFDMDLYRLLAFFVLIPAALRLRRSDGSRPPYGLEAMDLVLLLYGLLLIIFYARPDVRNEHYLQDSMTNAMRRGWLFFFDVYLLYWTVSRWCASQRALVDSMAAFALSTCVIAALAVFETLRHWPLYIDIATRWGSYTPFTTFLIRGGLLRAQASAGHPLALGYLLAIGIGFWLYLQARVKLMWKLTVGLLLWSALFASYSRGPWLGAVLIVLAFAASSPGAARRLFKVVGIAMLVALAVLVSPLGERIVKVIPFFGGTTDIGSVTYREQLAERSWLLIQQHPWFGDSFAYFKMQDLRQGQGIIDLVNAYAQVALFYGFIGLSLFLSFILLALWRAYSTSRYVAPVDADLAHLGSSLSACILGTIVMLFGSSFILGYEKMFYVLAGLAAGYAALVRSTDRRPVRNLNLSARVASAVYKTARQAPGQH
jgi:hypothetical protein